MTYPYSDEHLIFDERTKHYFLTKEAILDEFGIDLFQEAQGETNPDKQVEAALKIVSSHCYKYIHDFTIYNEYQDAVIATTKEGRDLIYEALLAQFRFVRANGDLTLSPDPEERRNYISDEAATILQRPMKYLGGKSLCYCGVW